MAATMIGRRPLLVVLLSFVASATAAMVGRLLDPHDHSLEFTILNGLASLLALYLGLGRAAPVVRILAFLLGLSAAIAWETTFGE